MNRRAMIKPPMIFAALMAATLAGCDPAPPREAEPITGVSITGAPIGGPFNLIDSHGRAVKWADFAGKYRMVYFGYTFCPDACPTDVAVMMQGLARFAKDHPGRAARVQPIFISIDPARDTPPRVGEFAAAFGPSLLGLTGSQARVDEAVAAFRVYAARGKNTAGGYLMDHSRIAYLMGPDGAPLEMLPVDQGAGAVAADLAASVR